MKEKHNGIISFWKFIFSLLIIALHVGKSHMEAKYNFNAGSIGVDFFFLVSGYLFCSKCLNTKEENEIGKSTISFILKKIKKFLPYIVFLWLISLPFTIFIEKYTITDFVYAIYNQLYITATETRIFDIYGIIWYIVVMIIIEGMLYPLLLKYKHNFIYLISPLIVFLGTNYLLIKWGTFAATWAYSILCYGGLIRGLVVINLGMILYLITEKIKQINYTKFSKIILTIFEVFGYLSIFYICNKYEAHIRFDLLMIIILSICIVISFSKHSLLYKVSCNKLFYTLERLSLAIYLNQWLIIHFIKRFIHHFNIRINYYQELLIVILISLLGAIIEEIIMTYYHKHKAKLKRIFIKEE